MINETALKSYLMQIFPDARSIVIRKLGEGVQGAGFLVEVKTPSGDRSCVVKGLFPEGLGHDYPADRASVFLLDLDEYHKLPRHVRAIDVLAELPDGSVKSVGGGREYYLLMERGEGRDYFHDLRELATEERLGPSGIGRIRAMAAYLADIHSVRKDSRGLYWRKVRDTIGHGECLMGVFDTYPDGTISYEEMAVIEKLCVDWRARLKTKAHRLCQIHGDFHPGNIWFSGDEDFILLDRSRGPWGDAADDVTALAVNYIFFSIKNHGDVCGAYLEGLRLFFDEYIRLSGDEELLSVTAPFFAFRAAVVANPVFYPDLTEDARRKIFAFARNVLLAGRFEVDRINDYIRD